MSRIGKQIISIPEKTTVTVEGNRVSVTGPGGELSRPVSDAVKITLADKTVVVTLEDTERLPDWGTTVAHIKNMIAGTTTPFQKKLIIEGIGFKAEVSGSTVNLNLGFSHQIKVAIPAGVKVTVEKNVMTIASNDKEMVGQFAATIRALKKPEPYKGKGIRYSDEVVKRKEGKRATATA